MPHDQTAHGKAGQTWNDVLPMSFWMAGAPTNVGNGAALGFVIDFTGAMKAREGPPKEDDIELVESAGKGERWYEKVEDSMHLHVETLTPTDFLEGAKEFLRTVGLDGPTQVSVDEQSLPTGAPAKMDLDGAIDACSEYLARQGESVRTIEITSHGKNERFSLLLDFSYRRKHRPMVPPVKLEVQAMSNELGPKAGESFADYRARMNALDSDLSQREKLYTEVAAWKKAMYSDYAHHLSEAFPDVRLQFYDRLPPGGA